MKQILKYILFLVVLIGGQSNQGFSQGYTNFKDCIVVAEQAKPQILIVNVRSGETVWSWSPKEHLSRTEHVSWFSNPSDAKVVYNGAYVLMCASGGACALIRIADKKVMFYAHAGKNPHSAELLPDGNIVCASSSDNRLTVFKTDTISFPEGVLQRSFYCDFAHNAVWDRKRNLLWTADRNQIKSWKYNFQCDNPLLTVVDSLAFDDQSGHDLFPAPGGDALFMSSASKMWLFKIKNKKLKEYKKKYEDVKSISARKKHERPIICIPKEQWWTDEIMDVKGHLIVQLPGTKIYKARWVVKNSFSYPDNDKIKACR